MLRTRALLPHFFNCGLRNADCGLQIFGSVPLIRRASDFGRGRKNQQTAWLSSSTESAIRNPHSAIVSSLRRAPLVYELREGYGDGGQEKDVYEPFLP